MSTRGVHWEWESKIELRFVFSFIQPPQGIVVLAVTRSSFCLPSVHSALRFSECNGRRTLGSGSAVERRTPQRSPAVTL